MSGKNFETIFYLNIFSFHNTNTKASVYNSKDRQYHSFIVLKTYNLALYLKISMHRPMLQPKVTKPHTKPIYVSLYTT